MEKRSSTKPLKMRLVRRPWNTSVQAEKTDPAELSAREFEDFLASIVTGVIQNVVDVRAGELKPDEASSRDDATVRTLAQILMGEHERIPSYAGAGYAETRSRARCCK